MILFTMAGASQRFADAGYPAAKFMLPLHGGTCFDHAVAGFLHPFGDQQFVFAYREGGGHRDFIESRVKALGISQPVLVDVGAPTRGQAETAERALHIVELSAEEDLTIFNIDTFRLNLTRPPAAKRGDGYLEVFMGSGDNWSFVEPADRSTGAVARTTEKVPISDLCCTGLYNFRTAADFHFALEQERRFPSGPTELYVAPIFNHLIHAGRDIRYHLTPVDDVLFCGVPTEYETQRANPGLSASLRFGS